MTDHLAAGRAFQMTGRPAEEWDGLYAKLNDAEREAVGDAAERMARQAAMLAVYIEARDRPKEMHTYALVDARAVSKVVWLALVEGLVKSRRAPDAPPN